MREIYRVDLDVGPQAVWCFKVGSKGIRTRRGCIQVRRDSGEAFPSVKRLRRGVSKCKEWCIKQ